MFTHNVICLSDQLCGCLPVVVGMKRIVCPPWGCQIMQPLKCLNIRHFETKAESIWVDVKQPIAPNSSIQNFQIHFEWMIKLKIQSEMDSKVCSKSRRRFYILHPRPQAGNGNMGNLLMIWHPCTENLHIVVLYCE